ncbi:uncharacterized protein LOC123873302 [Maniola jurtina]|uniref:uncharacterized protein LOC123873302 n=1 Tax=Maniola jurtina TaxID=191418 RepID=UPI001E68A731|nr:uncharacterized protein LOC123873302 [Maniola jurtina]
MDDKHQNVRVVTAESESKFVFDTCCCCIPLRTGCLILGYLQLVAYILYGIFSVLGIGSGVALMHVTDGLENKEDDMRVKAIATIVILLSALILVVILIALPFTIVLLVGLHKERRNYIKIYLIFAVIALVINVVVDLSKFSGGYAPMKQLPSSIIGTLLSIYFLLVLRSQYIKMGIAANNLPTQHYREGQLMNTEKV